MTTAYYKSARNYVRPQSAAPVHVPQPFLNYGGLSQMLKADYQYSVKDTPIIKNSPSLPGVYTGVPKQRAMSARQRYEQKKRKRKKEIILNYYRIHFLNTLEII